MPSSSAMAGIGGHREHDAPDVRILNEVVEQAFIGERQHLTGDDHQLVDRHHAAPTVCGRHLRQVQRAGHRGGADAEAEHDAGGHHDLDVGRERTTERADQEDPGTQQQRRLRPIRSATRPPKSAPRAAPGNSSELTTVASPNELRFRSSFM